MDTSREYPEMSKCYLWQDCSAPCCPIDPNLFQGRHWWYGIDDVCASRKQGKHPLVKAQRRMVKRPKESYIGQEYSVEELVERGKKKRTASKSFLQAARSSQFVKKDLCVPGEDT